MADIEVRQGRTRDGYIQVHYEWFDVYIPKIGTEAFTVWCLLSRYVNRNPGNELCGKAYPSRNSVCKTLKIGPATFTKSIATLQQCGLLDKEELPNGKYVYTVHEPLPKDEAEAVLTRTCSNENLFPTEQGAVPHRTGGGSVQNTKEIKEKDKEEKEKIGCRVEQITRVQNEDEKPVKSWGRNSQSQGGARSGVSRGLPKGAVKPPAKWNSVDLVRYWVQKWEQTYGQTHPRVRYDIEGRHMKKFLAEPYGPAQAKLLIDRFFERRSEFENTEYPTIGLQGLRQEWIIRKLLVGANVGGDSSPKSTLRVFQSEFLKAQKDWGEDVIPDRAAYFEFTGLDPTKVEWVDDV